MKYYCRANYIRSESRYNKEKDKYYYNAAILQGTETERISLSPEVYDMLRDAQLMQEFTFQFTERSFSGANGSWTSKYCVGLGDE